MLPSLVWFPLALFLTVPLFGASLPLISTPAAKP